RGVRRARAHAVRGLSYFCAAGRGVMKTVPAPDAAFATLLPFFFLPLAGTDADSLAARVGIKMAVGALAASAARRSRSIFAASRFSRSAARAASARSAAVR